LKKFYPNNGPHIKDFIYAVPFTAVNREGMTVLLIEQNAWQALNISHRGYVLETGCVSVSGAASELLHNDHVRKAYLGE